MSEIPQGRTLTLAYSFLKLDFHNVLFGVVVRVSRVISKAVSDIYGTRGKSAVIIYVVPVYDFWMIINDLVRDVVPDHKVARRSEDNLRIGNV